MDISVKKCVKHRQIRKKSEKHGQITKNMRITDRYVDLSQGAEDK